MKLYKYRSLENIEFLFDILLNQRLHCAPFNELNDPLEGIFLSRKRSAVLLSGHKTPMSIGDIPVLGRSRVCSLSAELNDVRLWSHYAQGHVGVAIEFELDESDEILHEVEYVDRPKEFAARALWTNSDEILRVKTNHWGYEREYRFITDTDFVSVAGQITGLYLGLRMPEVMRRVIRSVVKPPTSLLAMKPDERNMRVVVDSSYTGIEADD